MRVSGSQQTSRNRTQVAVQCYRSRSVTDTAPLPSFVQQIILNTYYVQHTCVHDTGWGQIWEVQTRWTACLKWAPVHHVTSIELLSLLHVYINIFHQMWEVCKLCLCICVLSPCMHVCVARTCLGAWEREPISLLPPHGASVGLGWREKMSVIKSRCS